MPAPPPSPRKTPRAAPYQPIPLSPKLVGLQAMLYELAKSERMDQLVNYSSPAWDFAHLAISPGWMRMAGMIVSKGAADGAASQAGG